ncbi:hypothetical protein BCT10_16570 [Vibrio splendidus]|nr:hypothetical protein BCT10_16570 [Vibrio splendidus]
MVLLSFVFSFSFMPLDISYLVLLLTLLVYFVIFLYTSNKIIKFELVTVILSFLFLFLQLLSFRNRINYNISSGIDSSLISSILFFVGMLAFPITSFLLRLFVVKDISKFICFLICSCNVYFIFELVTRLVNYDLSEHSFYVFKRSLFYLDSNFVALNLLSYLVFLFYLKANKIVSIKYSIVLVVFLIGLTFSRSSWLALMYMFFFLRFTGGSINKMRFYLPIVLCSFLVSSIWALFISNPDLFSSLDQSMSARLLFIERAVDNLSSYSTDGFLYGLGLASSTIIFGKYFHSVIAILIFEMGLLGSICFFFFLGYIASIERNFVPVLFSMVMLVGISLFSTNVSYLLFFASLMVFLNKYKEYVRHE